ADRGAGCRNTQSLAQLPQPVCWIHPDGIDNEVGFALRGPGVARGENEVDDAPRVLSAPVVLAQATEGGKLAVHPERSQRVRGADAHEDVALGQGLLQA